MRNGVVQPPLRGERWNNGRVAGRNGHAGRVWNTGCWCKETGPCGAGRTRQRFTVVSLPGTLLTRHPSADTPARIETLPDTRETLPSDCALLKGQLKISHGVYTSLAHTCRLREWEASSACWCCTRCVDGFSLFPIKQQLEKEGFWEGRGWPWRMSQSSGEL